jgi:5'-deoxynucleotidase YfbR-like HD superfamily hydrolase
MTSNINKQRITLFLNSAIVKHARAEAVVEDLTLTTLVEKALIAYLPKETVIKKHVEDKLFIGLPEKIQTYYIRLWSNSKDDTKEGRLVEAMDKFEILMFAVSEMDMGNYNSFKEIYDTAMNILMNNHSDIKSLIEVLHVVNINYGR